MIAIGKMTSVILAKHIVLKNVKSSQILIRIAVKIATIRFDVNLWYNIFDFGRGRAFGYRNV